MPPGIDHEIPRWSPLYSFYSEMCRLLPLASTPPSPSSENEENSADIEPTPNKQTADSAPTDDQTGKICIKGIGIPARSQCPPPRDKEVDWEQMLSAYEAGILQGSLASVETQSRNSGRNDVFTNNDLDALENIYTLV